MTVDLTTFFFFFIRKTPTRLYKLLNSSFGGSGYDVACGLADGPILYSKKQSNPKVESISLSPIFFEKLYFVYLNQKADSQKAVHDFDLNKVNTRIIKKLDNLTEEMSSTYDINKFKRQRKRSFWMGL